jgi:8-oxo-dGTP pyrophosphatase MutT (NUDIX family)
MRYGLPEPEGQAVPRVFFTERAGPIPLSALYDVAGDIDPATGAPKPGSTLPHKVFAGVEGTLPSNRIQIPSLAEQEYGETAMPMKPPPQPDYRPSPGPPPPPVVAKEAAALPGGGPTEGVISGTGIYSYDLDGQGDGEDDGDPVAEAAAAVAKAAAARAELGAFQRFARARRRDGRWRDFRFTHTGPVTAHRLNDAGRFLVLKAAGQAAVAGLAVRAAGTGRVLMLQRALDPGDPAGGTWEFPGGHIEDGESELQAAWREWAEETGCVPPPGEVTGEWAAGDGIYKGFVWTVESEDSVPVRGDSVVPNPDDPDGDQVEAIAWWDPGTLAGNPSVRAELAASLDDVMAALATPGPAQTIEPDGTE